MFRALMCSSSGELIVSLRHLVYVTLYRWPSGVQVWVEPKPAHQTVTYIEWHTTCRIDTINSPDDEHMSARNMQRFGINIYEIKNCASSWSFTRIIPRCTVNRTKFCREFLGYLRNDQCLKDSAPLSSVMAFICCTMLLRRVWSNHHGEDRTALPLVAMYWVWKVGFVVWVTNGTNIRWPPDTKIGSCRRCVVDMWP
jgi:hypothetical protein